MKANSQSRNIESEDSVPLENITNFQFEDKEPDLPDLTADVLKGLAMQPKTLNAMFFYDKRGSELFEQITRLPEYYVTRTEIKILQDHMQAIRQLMGDDKVLIEYGSGNSEKIRLLLNSLQPSVYLPIDISKDFLIDAGQSLAKAFPDVNVHAICADYNRVVPLPDQYQHQKKVAFFPGSTIGNFTPNKAHRFLENVRQTVGDEGSLLIGVDLKKDHALLHEAYNDSQGVTAEFNLNSLANINQITDSNFKLDQFNHKAFYNPDEGRIEMHLSSLKKQSVRISNTVVAFEAGETIHTENSYKYHVNEFSELANNAGFSSKQVWTDSDELFSIHYLDAA